MVEMESDSDNSDVNGTDDRNASVHVYMPVDQDSVESASDGVWRNATHEPSHHSLHYESGASYIPLQCMPEHTYSHQWHVFADSMDSSDTDEPLVDLGHIVNVVPTPSIMSANFASDRYPPSNTGNRYLCLEEFETGAEFRQHRGGAEAIDANVQGTTAIKQSWSAERALYESLFLYNY